MQDFKLPRSVLFTLLAAASLSANPSGERVVAGNCSILREKDRLAVRQDSESLIINWNDFSIGAHETMSFSQPASGAVLNRVISSTPSELYGALEANGRVFLINQNGILIGPSGQIRTGGFVASILDANDREFLEKKELLFAGTSFEKLQHSGKIEAGDVFLIGRNIESSGEIRAETAGLLAGSEVVLGRRGDRYFAVRVKGEGRIEHSGLIESVQAHLLAEGGDPFALAINHSGVIHASNLEEADGKVYLRSERGLTQVSGTLEGNGLTVLGDAIILRDQAKLSAPGGEILIGGDVGGANPEIPHATHLYVGENVSILADGAGDADGGKVILWADEMNLFYGTIAARGGSFGGDGGFVEISSPGTLVPQGKVDTSAPYGRTGTLLFDPFTVTISSGANAGFTFPGTPPPPLMPDPVVIAFTAAAATINNTYLSTLLDYNNVNINATPAGAGTGSITISDPVMWSGNTTLTLLSSRTITISSTVQNTHTGSGNFTAMDFTANGAILANYQGIVLNGGTLTSIEGNISLSGQGGNSGSNAQGIFSSAGGTISSTGMTADAARISLTGTAVASGDTNSGIDLSGVTISAQGPTALTTISLTGIGGGIAGSQTNNGVYLRGGTDVTATSGSSISITGTSGIGTALVQSANGIEITGAGTTVTTHDGAMTLAGQAVSPGSGNSGIRIASSGLVSTTGAGDVSLTGTTDAGAGANYSGIMIDGGNLTSLGSGSLVLNGTASLTGTSGNDGVTITSMAQVLSSGTGEIQITGTIPAPGGSFGFNNGVAISVSGTLVSSMTGDISILGSCFATAANGNRGVQITSGADVTSTGAAGIAITGTGGAGANTNYGVEIDQIGTSISSADGPIEISGTGGGSGTFGLGVSLFLSSISSTGTAPITITGTGSPTSTNSSQGVRLDDFTLTTMTGPVIITGTGAGSGPSAHGVYMETAQISSSVSGSISIVGTGAGPSGDGVQTTMNTDVAVMSGDISILGVPSGTGIGFQTLGGSDSFGGAASTGTVTVTSDLMNIVGDFTGMGQLVLQPIDPNLSIGVGTGETGTLNFTNAELNNILAGHSLVVFGRADGNHTISIGNTTLNNPTLFRGNIINIDNPITTGANNISFLVGPVSFGTLNFLSTITTTGLIDIIGGPFGYVVNLNSTSFPITVDGSAGVGTLVAPDTNNTWYVTGQNQGTLGLVSFINVPNLKGGSLDDLFVFSDQAGVAGVIDGGLGANTLDYNAFSIPAIVCFTGASSGSASNLGEPFINIGSAIGNYTCELTGLIAAFPTQISLSFLLQDWDRDDLFSVTQKELALFVDPYWLHMHYDQIMNQYEREPIFLGLNPLVDQ